MTEETDTAGPLGPEELQQEILALNDRLTKMAQLQQQMTEFLDKGLADQITSAVTKTLSPVVDAIQKKFDEHEGFMKQLAQSKGGGSGGVLDIIGKIIDKIPMGPAQTSNPFITEVDGMVKDIIKADLREMISTRRKGLTATPHVMTLEPKP